MRRDLPLAVLDAGVVLGSYLVTLSLRFDGRIPDGYWETFWALAPFIAAVYLAANVAFGLYRQMWRYASAREARRIVLASLTAGALVALFSVLPAWGERLLPVSVLVGGAALSLLGTGAVRFQSRLFGFRRRGAVEERSRVLVVGAGEAAEMVLRDILRRPEVAYLPVALVDDNPRKQGRHLHGVPVYGTRKDIPSLVARLKVDQVLFAIPSAQREVFRDVIAACEEADVKLRVLPSVQEIMGGKVSVRDVRDIRIDDLLGRDPVDTDLDAVAAVLRGRRVLVTGAGGSIGSEIAHQVARLGPAELLLLDHDESHLHEVVAELNGHPAQIVLADIRNRDRMSALFARHRPEVVFHAAAHKHVPFLEAHPEESVFTNVLGTANVADAALSSGASRFVLISTDKAIQPSSVMGASKRLAEQILWSLGGLNGCSFSAVRFGNVLGSRGSVIPTFFRQLARGEAVTITDPAMARYFMSVREAVQLVLQAAALAKGGEIFTLEMGEPVTIVELAQKVIRLSGRYPNKDVEISVVGARPGEKLVEEILDPSEEAIASEHPSIFVARPPIPDRAAFRKTLRELESLAVEGRSEELTERIKAHAGSARVCEEGARSEGWMLSSS